MQDASDHHPTEEPPVEEATTPQPDSAQLAPAPSRKRPRLDLTTEPRKRGKSMFGILVGTLNKAKDEDAQRNKSEAARRRMSLETKLQSKLALEQNELRRQGEIKRTRTLASRKEDDLTIQDSVLRLSHRIKPYLSHFLTTSDVISHRTTESPPIPMSLAPPVAAQTVLYYLPAILLPEQEAFLKERRETMDSQVENEQRAWRNERKQGMEEVDTLRRQAEELANKGEETEERENSKAPGAQEEPPAFPEQSGDPVPSTNKVDTVEAEEEALEY